MQAPDVHSNITSVVLQVSACTAQAHKWARIPTSLWCANDLGVHRDKCTAQPLDGVIFGWTRRAAATLMYTGDAPACSSSSDIQTYMEKTDIGYHCRAGINHVQVTGGF